jgi:hypothetical protein
MFTFDLKTRPSTATATSPAPKPASQHPVKAPPGNPLWVRLATSSNARAAASPEMTEERRRHFEPRLPAFRRAPWSRVERATSEADGETQSSPPVPSCPQFDFARIAIVPPLAQRKATISSPGDSLEHEADNVADAVVGGGLAPSINALPGTASVQRKCASCEEEEDELAGPLQRSADGSGLAVGPVDDGYEREADRVASEVVAGADARVEGRVGAGAAQREAGGAGLGLTASSIMGQVVPSHGAPLDAGTRAFMEGRLGHDFGSVRIHTDARANASAHAMNALAYTVGRDIVFRSGYYDPSSQRGQRLLAHELAHVCQQGAAAGLARRPGGRDGEGRA